RRNRICYAAAVAGVSAVRSGAARPFGAVPVGWANRFRRERGRFAIGRVWRPGSALTSPSGPALSPTSSKTARCLPPPTSVDLGDRPIPAHSPAQVSTPGPVDMSKINGLAGPSTAVTGRVSGGLRSSAPGGRLDARQPPRCLGVVVRRRGGPVPRALPAFAGEPVRSSGLTYGPRTPHYSY